jgi:hypothetical protein
MGDYISTDIKRWLQSRHRFDFSKGNLEDLELKQERMAVLDLSVRESRSSSGTNSRAPLSTDPTAYP